MQQSVLYHNVMLWCAYSLRGNHKFTQNIIHQKKWKWHKHNMSDYASKIHNHYFQVPLPGYSLSQGPDRPSLCLKPSHQVEAKADSSSFPLVHTMEDCKQMQPCSLSVLCTIEFLNGTTLEKIQNHSACLHLMSKWHCHLHNASPISTKKIYDIN